ncbi:hypothetical protein HMPREF1092_02746 [Clostridium thermobutyricum]|uniref:Uncharacterized protein n=1 Tax=Clostridium thermobutyricum TaxID=29372 RepID=N9WB57_9CLOT|nr:hypothetical protein [Clostridium thermobutyricum]ENZ00231.1 hypothetical protein HMPREF1092_02746 [Clostridium thermobutyricum]
MESKEGKLKRIYDDECSLTSILKCLVFGSGMVIMRTTNKLAIISYCGCGNWKNKDTAVCNSNFIRVDKANDMYLEKYQNFYRMKR